MNKEVANKVLPHISDTIKAARSNKIPVIYIVIGFRKGYPEINFNNKAFSAIKERKLPFDNEEAYRVDASITPESNEPVLIKKRFSAFTGSELDLVLKSQNINHIVLTGISTSGVVLSTVREAGDKDYKITVLEDCVNDSDQEIHNVLITKIFPRQADVISHKDWIDSINKILSN